MAADKLPAMVMTPDVPWRRTFGVNGEDGRTLRAITGPEPDGLDPVIGSMDTPALAAEAVAAHNASLAREILASQGIFA